MVTFTWGLSLDYCHIRTVKLLSLDLSPTDCHLICVTYEYVTCLLSLENCNLRTVPWKLSDDVTYGLSIDYCHLWTQNCQLKTVTWGLSLDYCHLRLSLVIVTCLLFLENYLLRTFIWELSFTDGFLQLSVEDCHYSAKKNSTVCNQWYLALQIFHLWTDTINEVLISVPPATLTHNLYNLKTSENQLAKNMSHVCIAV